MFNPWQSVKVKNDQSEYAGRAGVVIRPDGAGFVVQLDDTQDGKPKVLANFTADELSVL